VDVVITVRGKAVCCAEVKMKSGKRDIERLNEKTASEKLVIDSKNVKNVF